MLSSLFWENWDRVRRGLLWVVFGLVGMVGLIVGVDLMRNLSLDREKVERAIAVLCVALIVVATLLLTLDKLSGVITFR